MRRLTGIAVMTAVLVVAGLTSGRTQASPGACGCRSVGPAADARP
jgi:hypothetical protein